MDLDPSDDELDEYDPEAEFRDPESDSITIPEVETPESDSIRIPEVETKESDVPPELLSMFWTVVVVINAAVLAVSIGVLLLVFEGDRRGAAAVVGGVVLFGLAVRRYRSYDPDDGAEPAADPAGRNVPAETISPPGDKADSSEGEPPDDENRT